MAAQNSTLTSFPGGPSRPAGPVAPGSPCNSAKKKGISAQGQWQASNTSASGMGFLQYRTELSDDFLKPLRALYIIHVTQITKITWKRLLKVMHKALLLADLLLLLQWLKTTKLLMVQKLL